MKNFYFFTPEHFPPRLSQFHLLYLRGYHLSAKLFFRYHRQIVSHGSTNILVEKVSALGDSEVGCEIKLPEVDKNRRPQSLQTSKHYKRVGKSFEKSLPKKVYFRDLCSCFSVIRFGRW